MSAIPIHLQRRFEQRWASRFARPVVPKKSEPKPIKINRSSGRAADQRKNCRRDTLTFSFPEGT